MPEQGLDVDELGAGLEEPEGVTLMGAPSFAWRARCKPSYHKIDTTSLIRRSIA